MQVVNSIVENHFKYFSENEAVKIKHVLKGLNKNDINDMMSYFHLHDSIAQVDLLAYLGKASLVQITLVEIVSLLFICFYEENIQVKNMTLAI